jgi:hypothetical protein
MEEGCMLTPKELQDLWRDLADTRVLSVYLDSRVTDPAMREAWRPALLTAIRTAGASITDPDDRAEFDRAAAFLREPESPPGGMWSAPGWVAFATPNGVRYAADLPVKPIPLAVWGDGPVVAPFTRAMKQLRPVIVAMVESRSAQIHRYAMGRLEMLEELTAPDEEAGSEKAGSFRGASTPAARGAVGTETAQRRRQASFQRMAVQLGERLQEFAGDDGWVLLGGTTEWAHHAHETVAKLFPGRIMVSPTLHHGATGADIVRQAKDAASELRGTQGRVLVRQILDRAGGNARGAAGVPAVQRALRATAVDLLLVSPEFIRLHEPEAEAMVRSALAQGADVEAPSGDAAEELDRAAQGVAARLRFPINGQVTEEELTVPASSPVAV